MILLLIALVLALAAGYAGRDSYGFWSWSPAGFVALVLVILWLSGYFR